MNKYHVIYTDVSGKVRSEIVEFQNFAEVESWLQSIRASRWEIA